MNEDIIEILKELDKERAQKQVNDYLDLSTSSIESKSEQDFNKLQDLVLAIVQKTDTRKKIEQSQKQKTNIKEQSEEQQKQQIEVKQQQIPEASRSSEEIKQKEEANKEVITSSKQEEVNKEAQSITKQEEVKKEQKKISIFGIKKKEKQKIEQPQESKQIEEQKHLEEQKVKAAAATQQAAHLNLESPVEVIDKQIAESKEISNESIEKEEEKINTTQTAKQIKININQDLYLPKMSLADMLTELENIEYLLNHNVLDKSTLSIIVIEVYGLSFAISRCGSIKIDQDNLAERILYNKLTTKLSDIINLLSSMGYSPNVELSVVYTC
ncbi:MAG: hypothetical protein ARM1_0507 [Candidatus Micrarchaeota archaeon]|nr:MAG: hypothetical protein ARM1_0507 [Candidatus Micrarchaeota archaeon]